MQNDFYNAGIQDVQFILVAKSQHSALDGNWMDPNDIPIVEDEQSAGYPVWEQFGAIQRDLVLIDKNLNVVEKFNISSFDYGVVYNKILDLVDVVDDLIGDINLDGNLDVVDIVQLVNLILSNESNDNADINQDGAINVVDVVQLVNLILNK